MTIPRTPVAHGEPVQQRDVDQCAATGHLVHLVDGVDNGVCPRCGEVKIDPAARQAATAAPNTAATRREAWMHDVFGRCPAELDATTANNIIDRVLAELPGLGRSPRWQGMTGWFSSCRAQGEDPAWTVRQGSVFVAYAL